MPAKSKQQQKLFQMALAVRKGALSRDKVNKTVLDIVDGKMTDDEIKHFTVLKENDEDEGSHTGMKSLSSYVAESLYIKKSLQVATDPELITKEVREFVTANEFKNRCMFLTDLWKAYKDDENTLPVGHDGRYPDITGQNLRELKDTISEVGKESIKTHDDHKYTLLYFGPRYNDDYKTISIFIYKQYEGLYREMALLRDRGLGE